MARIFAPERSTASATATPPGPSATTRRWPVATLLGAAALVVSGAVGAVVAATQASAPRAAEQVSAERDGSLRPLSIELAPGVDSTDPGTGDRAPAAGPDGAGPQRPGGRPDVDDTGSMRPAVDELTDETHLVEDRRGRLVRVSRDVEAAELQQQAGLQSVQRMVALQALAQAAQDEAFELGAEQWVLPLAGYRLSAGFGVSGPMWAAQHSGQDFAAAEGTPLVAAAPGIVTRAGYDPATSWAGKLTVLRLADGTELWYAHQSDVDVRVGDTVAPGQVIGAVGDTGNSTGPHLHLEVRPGGGEAVDPLPALAEHGVRS